jgi:hypothetical protein
MNFVQNVEAAREAQVGGILHISNADVESHLVGLGGLGQRRLQITLRHIIL